MKYLYGSDMMPVEVPQMRQPATPQYKLQLAYFGLDLYCTVEKSFIPVACFSVADGDFTTYHNGVHLKGKDLRALVLLQPSIDIAVQCLTLFDLNDFMLAPGRYQDTSMGYIAGKTNFLLYLTENI